MRLSVEHETGFHYDGSVRSSYNEARMTPISSPTQSVWSSSLTVEPAPWSYTYTDYWGTLVHAFEVHDQHRAMTVVASSVVETRDDNNPWDDYGDEQPGDLSFAELGRPWVLDSWAELLTVSERTAPPDDLIALSSKAAEESSVRGAVLSVAKQIRERVKYETGSTKVQSTAADAWHGRSGVCQDLSHLAIGALRSIGIPTRYVSGYLHPSGAGAQIGQAVRAESHSWVEFWSGTDWVGFDPTSGRRPAEHYVRVGHGRDYDDIAPLRGTYAGGGSELFVTVTMTRLG
ncbi:transglutaminase family protein [Propionibacteriaceae bacterium Y1685]|uniref:transglutaminase family protein n=1 Tax=Microlunatus sp. Y1700 TaxID=3418487 RepID=UPI003B7B3A2B